MQLVDVRTCTMYTNAHQGIRMTLWHREIVVNIMKVAFGLVAKILKLCTEIVKIGKICDPAMISKSSTELGYQCYPLMSTYVQVALGCGGK